LLPVLLNPIAQAQEQARELDPDTAAFVRQIESMESRDIEAYLSASQRQYRDVLHAYLDQFDPADPDQIRERIQEFEKHNLPVWIEIVALQRYLVIRDMPELSAIADARESNTELPRRPRDLAGIVAQVTDNLNRKHGLK
jgi:hypothetical protein